MADSYFVTLEDPTTYKVGEIAMFSGEAGSKIQSIELLVDGYSIGEAKFFQLSPTTRSWKFKYVFKGAGKGRRLHLLIKAGDYVFDRNQFIDVEEAVVAKSESSIRFPVKIVKSESQHITQGNMELKGLVIHYTAGRITNLQGTINDAYATDKHPNYAYWVMAPDGTIYQTHELNRWGYHCATPHHKTHLGIEIMNPGKLIPFEGKHYAWFDLDRAGIPKDDPWPQDQIRYFAGGPIQTKGYYAKYTDAQEKALLGLIQYLQDTCLNFRVENVVGHDEILPDYKDDPGGSLSMAMPEFREYLKKVIV